MRLSINIDHIATLRNARGGDEPDPLMAAKIVERAGADGIVCHLREDRRHIHDQDVKLLRDTITTKLDLEMAATSEIINIALRVKPDLVTLVPEKRRELTTEGGLDVLYLKKSLQKVIDEFHDRGIPVSLFIDPVQEQIKAAKEINTDMIELHTGEYADARSSSSRRKFLKQLAAMAKFGRDMGLGVNAGHGLNYDNIKPIVAIQEIEEVSIGHAIIAHAVIVGLERAVREMVSLVKKG
ncbi:MAG: pyridoxine 5'-phosphate synthase [Ignavibacteriae bacterium]|nr:pyridoxine 5'-phosphate synthase [Ignavibacteriota bacterium]